MLTSKKKFFVVILVVLLLSFNLIVNKSNALVSQSSEFYVNDTANIIDPEVEAYIIDINKKLCEKTGAQIVVVTVNNLEGRSIEDYAVDLFRQYGIGDKEKNNGVLFLTALEERQTRIEVGYGLEGQITDGEAGRIISHQIVPYFKEDNWNAGVENGFNAILEEVCKEYDISIDGANASEVLETAESQTDDEADIVYINLFVLFAVCLVNRHLFRRNAMAKYSIALTGSVVASIIDCNQSGVSSFFSYLIMNLIAAACGLIGILGLIGGGRHSGGGSSGGGSHGGGGSSGGGGASGSF